ncbi:MAG: SAV_2336 N-terminal domain-related protein, partial [Cyanobium sp.]
MSSAEHPWQRLTTALAGRLDAPQIADLLWMAQLLAPQINRQPEPLLPPPTELLRPAQPAAAEARGSSATRTQAPSAGAEPSASPPAERPQPVALLEPATGAGPLPADAPRVSVAEAGLLQRPRRIGRALAPLNRPVAAGPARQLDVVATVEAIARARAEGRPWQPVLRPRLEPWLSLHLVFDAHPSMALWQQLRRELPRSLRQQVRWRDLRIWSAHRPSGAALVLRVGHGCPCASGQLRRPGGRDLVLVVSDAIASGWRDGTMAQLLGHWASQQPVLLLQVLPSRLWSRTGLGQRQTGWVKSRRVMQPNRQLRWQPLESDPSWLQPLSTKPPSGTLNLPLTSLDPGDLAAMAQLLSAGPGNNLLAVRLELKPPAPAPEPQAQADRASAAMQPDSAAIEQQLALFLFSASPQARRLLALLSFAPVITLPVVRLIQQQQVAGSGPAQIAEVLFSGLFRNLVPVQPARGAALVPPDRQQLCFVDEKLRPRLRQGLRLGEARAVFDAVSAHVAANLNLSLDHFEALLRQRTATESQEHRQLLEAFARVSPQCLRGLGRGYEQLADAIEESWADPTPKGDSAFPNPELLPFETAWLEEIELQPISFTTSTLIRQSGPGWRALGGSPDELIREDRKAKAWASFERLQAAGPLDLIMVWIPAGSFVMGSPYNEPEHVVNEGPQHQVTLEGFLIGQTPITQAQWRTVAQWQPQQGERWGRELAPNPSRFQDRS